MPFPSKIISGGQTGADRAGLDFAISKNIPHGGFCPKGRKSESGMIPPCYNMTETDGSYRERTKLNVESSTATVIFCQTNMDGDPSSRGSLLTANCALDLKKEYLVIDSSETAMTVEQAAHRLSCFLLHGDFLILNVAGNRESVNPGIYKFTLEVLNKAYMTVREQTALVARYRIYRQPLEA